MSGLLIAILVLALLAGVSVLVAISQIKRARKAEAEVKALHDAVGRLVEKANRLEAAIKKNTAIEENANAERQELSQTDDAGLVHRANELFLCDDKK